LTPSGLEHMKETVNDVLFLGSLMPSKIWASRIDIAVDLHGISPGDFVWDIPAKRSREQFFHRGDLQTLYLGSKRAGRPMVVYDKARQQKLPAEVKLTRIEYRSTTKVDVSALWGMENPFSQ